MSALILPSRRVVQPQEGFALDERFDPHWVFVPQSKTFDLAGRRGISYLVDQSPPLDGGIDARFVRFTGGARAQSATTPSPGSDFIAVVQYKNLQAPTNLGLLVAKQIFSNSYGFYVAIKSANTLEISPSNSSFPTATVTGVGDNDGLVKTLVFDFRGTTLRIYTKGALAATVTLAVPIGAWTTGFALNGYTSGGGTDITQTVAYSLAAILRKGDPAALSLNPWQIFRPIQRRIWASVAEGGGVTGSLAATEAGSDTFASSGTVLVSGSLSVTESGADTFASTGTVTVAGSLNATESGADTFAATGSTTGGITGSLNATEAGADTAALSGAVLVAGLINATESGADTFAASGVVVVTGLLSATEAGQDTFAAVGFGGAITGSLNAQESGSDTFFATNVEQQTGGKGFEIVDMPSRQWWKRKPKAIPEQVAEQRVKRVVRAIQEVTQEQAAEPAKAAQSAAQQQREVYEAIAPMLAEMPGFDWKQVFRQIVEQDTARRQMQAAIARARFIEQDDEDVLLLMF